MRAARRAVTATFLLNGLLFGSWAARIPAVRERVGLSDAEQGIALACIAFGAVIAMPVSGALATRLGSRLVTRVSLALACAATGLVALAGSLLVLCVLALALGAAMGALDVSMNAHGVAVERRYRRPILAGFHAAFSIGGLGGAALGAAAAAAQLDVRIHLALVAAASAAVGIRWSASLLPAGEDAAAADTPLVVRPPRGLWALGALAFACLLIEGACADWSAVYLRIDLGASAAVAALGFAAFSVTMTAGRLTADRLTTLLGPSALVRVAGGLAATGFGLALLAGSPVAAIVGFACLGAGMAPVIPIAFRSAGLFPGVTPGVGLGAVSSTGYLGFLAGPPMIGAVAELTGLPTALWLLVGLALLVCALGTATRPKPVAQRRLVCAESPA
jgi:MFS family permease